MSKKKPSKRKTTAEVKQAKELKALEKAVADAEARKRRLESDFEPLQPGDEDFDVSVGNERWKRDPQADKEKKQEYSRSMGEFAQALNKAAHKKAAGQGSIADNLPPASGTYIARVAEQERRFGNRRGARSVSLAAAQEELAIGQFKIAAVEYLSNKITPTGYARKKPEKNAKRSVVLLLSDLHLGAELSSLDSPMPFGAIQEARRLEFVLRQALDYKPQYRKDSELLLLLNGDLIQGLLLHDLRDGAPLTEQKVIFWSYFRQFLGYCAQQYPSVRVVCQPGNHGRDKVRHPGRATSRKWDGHEWEMYWALKAMCSELHNVSWQIDFRAVSVIDLYGQKLGMTHGDTEIKLGAPDRNAEKNGLQIASINNTLIYGARLDALAVGHFHTPRFHPGYPTIIYNGALIPPDGHARTSGYINEPCGQFMWEATIGFPVGDLRFIGVGRAQDEDSTLGNLITPFRFSLNT